jgi:hypothetical protein
LGNLLLNACSRLGSFRLTVFQGGNAAAGFFQLCGKHLDLSLLRSKPAAVVAGALCQGIQFLPCCLHSLRNTLHQNFYSLLNASVAFDLGERVNIELWGRNLLNADYYTFYFKSMTNNFYNYGKPCRIGATVSFAL